MARRRGNGWGKARAGRLRPLGLSFALLALLCQSLILFLPAPAMALAPPADPALFPGGYIICQVEDGPDTGPAADHDAGKSGHHHCVDCPFCQAIHFSGGLAPPPPPTIPTPAVQPASFIQTLVPLQPLRLAARAHQPRAPPSIERL